MRTFASVGATPWNVDALKAWLRIGHTAEDDVLGDMLDAAAYAWEQVTGFVLRSVTVTETVVGAPADFLFSMGPRVTAVTVTNAGTSWTPTESSDDVRLFRGPGRPRLAVLVPGAFDSARETTIEYTAEPLAAGGTIPPDIKAAVFQYAGTLYENRESVAPVMLHAVSHGWRAIASRYGAAPI